MTTNTIKDNYAKSVGYQDWESLCTDFAVLFYTSTDSEFESLKWISDHIDQVMKLYAMECLKKASDEVTKSLIEGNNSWQALEHIVYNENNLV